MASVGRGLATLAGALLFLTGPPTALIILVGWPLPRQWPTLGQVAGWFEQPVWTAPVLIRVGACLLWLLWAGLVLILLYATAVNIAAATRGIRATRVRLPAPLRTVATSIAGSLLVLTSSTSARAGLSADAAAQTPAVTMTTGDSPHLRASLGHGVTQPDSHTAQSSTDAGRPTYRVRTGDTLWDIAGDKLGDPRRWREIYHLNRGKPQRNGYALTNPAVIHVGWTLTLPTTSHPRPSAPPTAVDGNQAGGSPDGHAAPTPPVTPQATPPADAGPAPDRPNPGVAATPTHSPSTDQTGSPPATVGTDQADQRTSDDSGDGVTLPSQSWISLGLAATIAAAAALLRVHRRRHAILRTPIPLDTTPRPSPVPASLAPADAAGIRTLNTPAGEQPLTGLPSPPPVRAPVGVNHTGADVSLFDLPGAGVALDGPGAEPAARAILASALATGALDHLTQRPVVVTTTNLLARLLPDHDPHLSGLDPQHTSWDGERLIVLADTTNAVTHAEEELTHRRRILDSLNADTTAALNPDTEHAEQLPPYVFLIDANPHLSARINAVAAHRDPLDLHPVILGATDAIPTYTVAADGTTTTPDTAAQPGASPVSRLATLTPAELSDVLALVAATAPRPVDDPDTTEPGGPPQEDDRTTSPGLAMIPAPSSAQPAPVHLAVLGPVTVTTAAGPIQTGLRSGSYAVLAVLAAHPGGRTLDQITTDVYPDTHPDAAIKRVRTDITTARRVLRDATGNNQAMFIVYDPATTRYHLDPDTIDVDLWRMLTAIRHANLAEDDTEALTALREAASLYRDEFADGQDRAWITDYATTYRHHILNVYARIAEILETDHPDQATDALEHAITLDPINEELYQRLIRIHGRQHRPDAVRRTLNLLEQRLVDIGQAEPSETTRRLATRQLNPARDGPDASRPLA